ncbi:hypothetical protein DF185_06455 [Marinifilum breve]|uniref:Uncharacterized protein n=1 Tax=Marinifilum breve TaxID=2184082 RepID=A0A2V4A197_9BACT|nr:AsmA-like C-terminal region-containing protein [Marinifilum breve]PXY02283.1 hypothetical protein DF185_06455 [Marinifilum breve]
MNRIPKILKRFIAILLSLCIVLVLIAEMAEDFIAKTALNQINSDIDASIEIQDISFSLLKRFPYATIEFENILIQSKLNKDTLLGASKAYASLHTIDLINGNINTKKLELKDGFCNYIISHNNQCNLDCLLSIGGNSNSSESSSSQQLDLNKVLLNNIRFFYADSTSATQAEILIDKTEVKGKGSNNTYQAKINGNAVVSNCNYQNSNLHKLENAQVSYQISLADKDLHIENLLITSKGVNLHAKGNINLQDKLNSNINILTCNVQLDKIKQYIPKDILYNNQIQQITGTLALTGSIEGNLSDTLLPRVQANFKLSNAQLKKEGFPALQKLNCKGSIDNGAERAIESTRVICENLDFTTEKSSGSLSFDIVNLDKPSYKFDSNLSIDLEEVKSFLPDSLMKLCSGTANVHTKGKGKLNSLDELQNPDYLMNRLQGKIDLKDVKASKDSIQLDSLNLLLDYKPNQLAISLAKGTITSHNIKLKKGSLQLNLEGKLSNLKQLKASIDSIHLQTNQSLLSGNIQMENVTEPNYKLHLLSDINLQEFKHLIPDSLITNLNGSIITEIHSAGKLNPDSIDKQIVDLVCNHSQIKANCKNISIKSTNPSIQISDLSGQFKIQEDTITLHNTTASAFGINMNLDSTKIGNYYHTIVENKEQKLSIYSSLHFDQINYQTIDSLLQSFSSDTDNAETKSSRNYSYEIKGKLRGDHFTYQKAKANNISTLFNISDSIVLLDKFEFDAFKGNLNNSVRYKIISDNKQIVNFYNHTENLDIAQLMKDFNNFKEYEQEYIKSEQISGTLSSDLHGEVLLMGDSLVHDSTLLKGDFKLEDGGLFNFKPAMELSKSTNIEELDNMHFKTIESKVFVFKNAVYIPQTEIKSNAMDISAYGMQSFNDDYEYHLRVYLGEVLRGKTKRIREKQEKQENKPDGGTSGLTSLFLVSKNIDGKSHSGLDTKKGRAKMKTKIKLQQVVLDFLFHPKLIDFDTKVEENPTKHE